MSKLTDADIQAIITKVKSRVSAGDIEGKSGAALLAADAVSDVEDDLGDGVFSTIDEAVGAAKAAFESYRALGLDARHGIIDAVRASMRENNERLDGT